MKELTNEEIQQIYDYSKSKLDICKKLDIRINQNGLKIDNDILKYFSLIGITQRNQISKVNLTKHWEEIKKRDYEVESLVIPYFDSQKEKYRCAIPDFYIPNQNLIVEIKSNWTLNKQNMIDKFESYKQLGYNYKLICEHKEIKL